MKLNGKLKNSQSTISFNNWLPGWLAPLVETHNVAQTQEHQSQQSQQQQQQSNERNLRANDNDNESNDLTLSNSQIQLQSRTKSITPVSVFDSQPPPPRYNEPYFNLYKFNEISNFKRYLYLILIYSHVPITIFFDANILYVLIVIVTQLGLNSYIFALAVYLLSLVIQYILVFIVDLHTYKTYWSARRPIIIDGYLNSKLFNLNCVKSIHHFNLMWCIRNKAFKLNTRDFLIEYTNHLYQNWPLLSTNIPRCSISIAIVLQFWHSNFKSISPNAFYHFDASLTSYAKGILIAHIIYTFIRTIIVVFSLILHYTLSSSLFGYPLPYDDKEALKYAADSNLSWAWKERTTDRIESIFKEALSPAAQEKRFSSRYFQRPITWAPNPVRLNADTEMRRHSTGSSSNNGIGITISKSAPIVRINENNNTDIQRNLSNTAEASTSTSNHLIHQSNPSSPQTTSSDRSQSPRQLPQNEHESLNSAGLFSNASWHTPEREPTIASTRSGYMLSHPNSPFIRQGNVDRSSRESTTSMSSVGAVLQSRNDNEINNDGNNNNNNNNNNNGEVLPNSESYGLLPSSTIDTSSMHRNQHSHSHSRQSSYERQIEASESRDGIGPIHSSSRMLDDLISYPASSSMNLNIDVNSNENNNNDNSNISNIENNNSNINSSSSSSLSSSSSRSSISRMSSFIAKKITRRKRSSSRTVTQNQQASGEGSRHGEAEIEPISPPPPYTPTVSGSQSRDTIEHLSPAPQQSQQSFQRQQQRQQIDEQSRRMSRRRESAEPIGLGLSNDEEDNEDINQNVDNDDDDNDTGNLSSDSSDVNSNNNNSNNNSSTNSNGNNENDNDDDDGFDWDKLRIESKAKLNEEQKRRRGE